VYGKTLNQIAGSDISITSMWKWVFHDITAVTRSAETLTDASFCLCSVIFLAVLSHGYLVFHSEIVIFTSIRTTNRLREECVVCDSVKRIFSAYYGILSPFCLIEVGVWK
jgi:hypothetical protein